MIDGKKLKEYLKGRIETVGKFDRGHATLREHELHKILSLIEKGEFDIKVVYLDSNTQDSKEDNILYQNNGGEW